MWQVNSAWAIGDFNGARHSSKQAKEWSIVAMVSHVITLVAVMGFTVLGVIIVEAINNSS